MAPKHDVDTDQSQELATAAAHQPIEAVAPPGTSTQGLSSSDATLRSEEQKIPSAITAVPAVHQPESELKTIADAIKDSPILQEGASACLVPLKRGAKQ